MATLALGALGAAVGTGISSTATFLGMSYAQIGWAVGSAAGSILFAPEGQDIEGPRLADLSVQGADYGTPKPETWGTMRHAGQIIDSTSIQETKHEEEADGGKGGGGGGTYTSYTYSITCAVAFGEGPIDAIRKIWMNGKLVYTRESGASAASISASLDNIAIYLGDESQQPDPTLESIHGSGNVPAYRGTPYIVLNNLQLEDYGNRLPLIEAELVRAGTIGIERTVNASITVPGTTTSTYSSTSRSFTVYHEGSGGFNKNVYLNVRTIDSSGGESPAYRYFLGYPEFGVDDYYWVMSEGVSDEPCAFMYHSDYSGIDYVVFEGDGGGVKEIKVISLPGTSFNNPYMMKRGDDLIIHCFQEKIIKLKTDNSVVAYDAIDLSSTTASGLSNLTSLEQCSGISDNYLYILETDLQTVAKFNIDTMGLIEEIDLGVTLPSNSMFHIVSDDVFYLINNEKNLYYYNGSSTEFIGDLESGVDLFEQLNGSYNVENGVLNLTSVGTGPTHEKYTLEAVSKTSTALSNIVSDLCDDAGLVSDDYDVSALTQVIQGYTRSRVMPARSAIQPLQRVYFFDCVESDWKIKFVNRGAESVVTITEDDLGAHASTSRPTDEYFETRSQEVEIPREVVAQYFDVNGDYQQNAQRAQRIITESDNKENLQLPIAETADKMAQVCEILLYDAWLSRTTQKFTVSHYYEYLDPSDVITVTENGNTHNLRIARIKNGEFLELECVNDSASNYDSSATGFQNEAANDDVAVIGDTKAILLDIPILQDADDNAGFYGAARGYEETWDGSVVYSSTDGGETYAQAKAILNKSVIGYTTDALSDGETAIVDYGNSVNIYLPHGELSTITDAAFLDGSSNAAAIGNDATGWEIIQFRDATLESDGSYTLSHLARGLRGTEWMTGSHQIGDYFVLLTSAGLERFNTSLDSVGAQREYKAVTVGKNLVGTDSFTFTNDGIGLKPYSPVHLEAFDNGDGTFYVQWVRRTRVGGEWRDNVDVPLGEESESYRVKVFTGATENSSATVSTSSATVTASSGDTIKVAQISASVGDGYYAEVTV